MIRLAPQFLARAKARIPVPGHEVLFGIFFCQRLYIALVNSIGWHKMTNLFPNQYHFYLSTSRLYGEVYESHATYTGLQVWVRRTICVYFWLTLTLESTLTHLHFVLARRAH